MTEKQIKNKIDRFNKKLTKQIEKFVDNVEKTSIEFKDLFPTMSEEELKGKIVLFKQILEKCLLSFETDYDDIVSGAMSTKEETNSNVNEKSEIPPRKIEIVHIP